MEIKSRIGNFILDLEYEMEAELFLKLTEVAIAYKNSVQADKTTKAVEFVNKLADQLMEDDNITVAKDYGNRTMSGGTYKLNEVSELDITSVKKDLGIEKAREFDLRAFLERQEKKFVIGRCDCGHNYCLVISPTNRPLYYFGCKSCDKQHVLDLRTLIPASYKCPHCKTKSTFWAERTDILSVDCKCCNDEIILIYDEKKQALLSN